MGKIKLLTPQEIEVWYILPAIRKEFAKVMIEKGLNQKETAKKLHLTEPAISQYLKDKRAKEIKFNPKVKAEIKKSVDNILKDSSTQVLIMELQKTLKVIKQEMILCDMHKKVDSTIPSNCDQCVKLW